MVCFDCFCAMVVRWLPGVASRWLPRVLLREIPRVYSSRNKGWVLPQEWALRNCPDGPARDFGQCVADDGVVVQERAGETAIVAVAIDVVVATPETKTDLTLVFRPE